MTNQNQERQLAPEKLAALLQLQRRARDLSECPALEFLLVNESQRLVSYRQAALWFKNSGVKSHSGLVEPDKNSPYIQYLSKVFRAFSTLDTDAPFHRLSIALLSEWGLKPDPEWFAAQTVALPLRAAGRSIIGWVLLTRDEYWGDTELGILSEWVSSWSASYQLAYAHSQTSVKKQILALGESSWTRWRLFRWLSVVSIVALLFVPVRLTVLATAEVVPLNPQVIRAPMDGVVADIFVQPNEEITADARLYSLDKRELESQVKIASRELDSLNVEFRQVSQQVLTDPRLRPRIRLLEGQIAEKQAEIAYIDELLNRTDINSPTSGIVLLDDPSEWLGRPVQTGEKIMVVAQPGQVEIEAWLSPTDLIELQPENEVTLFLNSQPLNPVPGKLRYLGHEALPRNEGTLAYRIRASITDTTLVRLGAQGTLKIAGDQVSVAYWVLRRPLAALRSWVGF
ncbi:MAG: HlyD family efflux transporter periplasmic adaptor subunit [Oceanospirillaceae bacterium]|nr:HlyD family efflux transporter periplasmic adaptor subunit [Oceanospirillaceae bacterium]